MDDHPMRDPRILEALEACRPGKDDLSDPAMERLATAMAASPELDDLYERLQRLDAALAAAFRDVPVPQGLQQRIVERLAKASLGVSPQAAKPADPQVGSPRAESAAAEAANPCGLARASRRRWLAGLGAVVVIAASLLLAAWLNWGPWPLGDDVDWSAAIARFGADLQSGDFGSGRSAETAPARFPFSAAVVQYPGTTWRPVRDFLGRSAIAYDLQDAWGLRATLYVVQAAADLPDVPDLYQPLLATGQCALLAWREGNLVYVLVAQGGGGEYRRFLNVSGGPVV